MTSPVSKDIASRFKENLTNYANYGVISGWTWLKIIFNQFPMMENHMISTKIFVVSAIDEQREYYFLNFANPPSKAFFLGILRFCDSCAMLRFTFLVYEAFCDFWRLLGFNAFSFYIIFTFS